MTEYWTLGKVRRWILERLRERGAPSAQLDTDLLLGHALALDRLRILLELDRPLTSAEREQIRALVRRRLAGEPVAYILGRKGFLDFEVTIEPGVLVPRPESEFLVLAAGELAAHGELPSGPTADLGTGSGALAVGVARALGRPVVAIDRDPVAVRVAQRNLAALASTPWMVVRGDWADPLASGRFALALSNPPYLAEAELANAPPELCHEPRSALVAGPTGLEAIEHLGRTLPRILLGTGIWICEVGAGQRPAVERLLSANGWQLLGWWRDYGGIDRCFAARRPQ